METTVKINTEKLVADIKAMSAEQTFLKNQRKTVHIIGERKMSAYDAAMKHLHNRTALRAMYAVYGLSKGMTYSQIENTHPLDNHPLEKEMKWTIEKIQDKYKLKEEKVI